MTASIKAGAESAETNGKSLVLDPTMREGSTELAKLDKPMHRDRLVHCY